MHEGVAGDGTVNDYMKVLFRERSWGDMAESETYAHLEHLRTAGDFVGTSEDGLARYDPARAVVQRRLPPEAGTPNGRRQSDMAAVDSITKQPAA